MKRKCLYGLIIYCMLNCMLICGCGQSLDANIPGEESSSYTETISENDAGTDAEDLLDDDAVTDTGTLSEDNIVTDTTLFPETNGSSDISQDNSVTAVPEAVPEVPPAPPAPPSATIVMVGDILLHTKINESGKYPDGSYNYDHLFANVAEDIAQADLALVNQEIILGGRELGLSGYPTFNGAFEVGDALVNAGFDVVLHATNHALDKRKTGLLNCLNFWHTSYPEIGVVGIYESQEAQDTIYITEVNGIRIAILNYTYSTNGIPLPDDMPFAVNYLDETQVREDICLAEELADFTIVCPHWGTEYKHEASASQKEWARIFAEEGADLCIGTHPHVIQPIEWYEAENGNQMLVYYSIGNFINSTSRKGSGAAERMCGGMAQITLTKEESGSVVISHYDVEPLVTQVLTGTGLITTYKFSDYTPELAELNEIRNQDPAFTYEYCEQIFKYFGLDTDDAD